MHVVGRERTEGQVRALAKTRERPSWRPSGLPAIRIGAVLAAVAFAEARRSLTVPYARDMVEPSPERVGQFALLGRSAARAAHTDVG
jgi:hypothetical protein